MSRFLKDPNTPIKAINIQTLDEILASLDKDNPPKPQHNKQTIKNSAKTKNNASPKNTTKKQPTKLLDEPKDDTTTHTKTNEAKTSKTKASKDKTPSNKSTDTVLDPQAILATFDNLDNHQEFLDKFANTPQEPLYDNDKDNNRLRWLAFYYLSRRELSTHELRAKLKAKDFDDDVITPLIDEFIQKDYQSNYRCASMLVREAIRKNRGRQHIYHSLKKAKIDLQKEFGLSLDEFLAQIGESLSDGTILENEQIGASDQTVDDKATHETVDWLLLAVEARTKKYGNTLPKDPKEKNRQLRFLQYRGFELGVCFDALKLTLDDF